MVKDIGPTGDFFFRGKGTEVISLWNNLSQVSMLGYAKDRSLLLYPTLCQAFQFSASLLLLLPHQAWFPHSPSHRSVSTPWALDSLNYEAFCNYKCPVYLKRIRGYEYKYSFFLEEEKKKTEPGKETKSIFIFHVMSAIPSLVWRFKYHEICIHIPPHAYTCTYRYI